MPESIPVQLEAIHAALVTLIARVDALEAINLAALEELVPLTDDLADLAARLPKWGGPPPQPPEPPG